jgi:putative hydrolase of the HAD superfamily
MKIKHLFFDWGDTLMVDNPNLKTPMATWDKVSACAGVIQAMPLLAELIPCSVVSNASDSNGMMMKRAFERVDLDGYFQYFLTPKELNANKPTVEFFVSAAAHAGIKPSDACMIGNSYENDIIGAKNAGLTTVLIAAPEGHYPAADYVIGDFSLLPDMIKKLSKEVAKK